MEVIMLEGSEDMLDTLRAMSDISRLERAEGAARVLMGLSRRMVAEAEGNHDKLVEACADLLACHNPDPEHLNPANMAERMTRIAALPKHAEVTDDGRTFFASISDPLGNGEVWCEFPVAEFTRRGLAKSMTERKAKEAPVVAPAPTTPQ